MSIPNIIEEKPITMAELKAELDDIKKRDKELSFRSNKTQEYLSQFSKKDYNKVKELIEKIEKLKIPRLKEEHIVKIIDVMPQSLDDLKSLLQGYTVTIKQENMKKIVEVVKKFFEDGKKK